MPMEAYLFLTLPRRAMTRNSLQHVFRRLSKRSGVERIHPHLCRHTFAVRYLMNGGDVFTLQRILGHTTLAMVNHYLRLSRADVAKQHLRYSPLDRFDVRLVK